MPRGESNQYGDSSLQIDLFWRDKTGVQVVLRDAKDLALALKEKKMRGLLTVTANAFLKYWSDIDNVIE